jgi:sorbitol/mannitol transport system substrate-binding protein
MQKRVRDLLFVTLLATASVQAQQKTITIGMVNNPDMLELKRLSAKFTEENPDLKLDRVILEEKMLQYEIKQINLPRD